MKFTDPKDVAKVETRQAELDEFSEKVQAGHHGTALQQRGEDKVEGVRKNVLLHCDYGARVDLHHGA